MDFAIRWIAPVVAAVGLLTNAIPATAAQPLVNAEWVYAHKDDPNVVVLDVRNGITEADKKAFEQGHIPGAVYSDYLKAGWRTAREGVPGQLPTVEHLEALIGGLGIDNDDHVIVVAAGESALDMGSATRVYWTFKVLGHDEVSVLNGGHKAYAAKYKLAKGSNTPKPALFTGELDRDLLASREEVEQALRGSSTGFLDNRPAEQFRGETKHPAATKPGTLPGAGNVPESRLTMNGGEFVDAEQVAKLMKEAGLDRDGEQVAFCNTGHWASLGWFAVHEILGNEKSKLYDGSMTEWTKHNGEVEVIAEKPQ